MLGARDAQGRDAVGRVISGCYSEGRKGLLLLDSARARIACPRNAGRGVPHTSLRRELGVTRLSCPGRDDVAVGVSSPEARNVCAQPHPGGEAFSRGAHQRGRMGTAVALEERGLLDLGASGAPTAERLSSETVELAGSRVVDPRAGRADRADSRKKGPTSRHGVDGSPRPAHWTALSGSRGPAFRVTDFEAASRGLALPHGWPGGASPRLCLRRGRARPGLLGTRRTGPGTPVGLVGPPPARGDGAGACPGQVRGTSCRGVGETRTLHRAHLAHGAFPSRPTHFAAANPRTLRKTSCRGTRLPIDTKERRRGRYGAFAPPLRGAL